MGVRNNNSTNYVHSDEPNLLNLHKALEYNSLGQPLLRVTGSTQQYQIDIALGNYSNISSVYRHGYNSSIANNTEESLWQNSTLYPWSAWTGPTTIDFTSSSTADVNRPVLINGLDGNFALITEIVTINGTGTVTTANTFIRINDITNVGNVDIVGSVSGKTHGTANVVAFMNSGTNHSQNGFYTVPAGYTGVVFQGAASMGKGQDGELRFKARQFNYTFVTAHTVLMFQDNYVYPFTVPFVAPEKTDLDVTVTAGASGAGASCSYDIILIKNTAIA